MADPTRDEVDDGFHEIHLSGKQLVFLFMATTVVSVVIFLCGVLVGRGVRAERADTPESPIPGAAASSGAAVPYAGPPAAEPPSPPAEGELSYKKRLESEGAPPESLKKPAEAERQPARPAPPAATETPARSPQPDRAGPSARPGTWVVQVHALRDRSVADALVRRLNRKGYPAFLVSPAAGAPTIYRVQVGRFTDRAEAEQVVARLKKEEQLDPWVTR